ncbi:hypothetical protein H2248_009889 [Termitomyces sp. 'cryptogamus']|nr:hypothetical protein H2248_009889 [Termitomyces sp. 'cryptogamus']
MIQMEVDCHSSSSMMHTKRARSPGSPHDRPNKRPLLTRLVTPHSPASSSRFPSEDWVQQTDGLTIHSPVIVDPWIAEDRDIEDMNIDSEGTMLIEPPRHPHKRPALPPIQTAQMNLAHASLFRHHLHQNTPISTGSSTSTPPGPLVTVFPPTPIPTSSAQYINTSLIQTPTQTQTPPCPSTPVDDSARDSTMVLSPGGSSTVPASRKQRFTMGPRADCIKCRMNVKGHSVHY